MTSDEPGTPPDRPSGPARRSRRAGRTSQSYDFRARFGDPQPSQREGLREPSAREQRIPGRGRLTVRELMAQMGVEQVPGQQPPAPQYPQPGLPGQPVPPPAGQPPVQQPQAYQPPAAPQAPPSYQPPVPPQGYQPPAGQPQPPATPVPQPPRRPRRQTPPPPALPPITGQQPAAPEPPRPPVEQPTHESTQLIPPVTEQPPAVDLSEARTHERVTRETRGWTDQDVAAEPAPAPTPDTGGYELPADDDSAVRRRRRPLEPTPDLTGALKTANAKRKSQATPKRRTRRPMTRGRIFAGTGRVLLSLACVLTLVGTGYVWSIQRGWNNSWNLTKALNTNDKNIRNKDAQYGDENYLVVGTDSRAGKNGDLGAGDSSQVEGIRSDTVLLVHVPADRSRVVAVSWPRDLAVDRPECEEWDSKTGGYDGTMLPGEDGVKLNSVYAVGGPKCLVKTLTQISGLEINHFIAMDFEGFEKVVNVIGGVQVCSTVPLYDYELGYILRKKGTYKLKGRRALNYVRARNISAEGNGDYGRIKRQQLFMSSLLRGALSGDVLKNPAKMNRIVNTFIKYSTVDNVDTDSLIQLADSMQGMDAGAVTFITIPTAGTTTDGENNEIPRTDDINAIFNAIIDDKPLPGEKKPTSSDKKDDGDKKADGGTTSAPKQQTASQVDATAQYPSNTTVRVLNGSGQTGVATDVMNKLISEDFTVPGVADASTKRDDTVVRYGPGEQDSAATVAKMIPGARIQEDKTVKVGVEVILGKDFTGVDEMTSPASAGSTLSVGQLPPANTNSDLPNDLAVTNAGDTTCS
ncbi:MAG: LCP family protein [Gordonia sp. (in: high G+C Gram-positive bacteria)]|uniref:LCP family protein n=1 Tax=Gordonia sp. (in: high G+C Gram-positive bacteria) TaxID=84139 RepID=UPI0039E47A6A